MSETAAHQNTINEYRKTQTGKGWHTAPDDGYLYDHLALHLKEAGLFDELRGLFADANWLHARAKQGGYVRYLADLQVAWDVSYEVALRQIESGQEAVAFADCVHYALVESSLRSWAESRTPAVVARAVVMDFWTAERALSLAAIIPDEQRRSDMYAALSHLQSLTSEQTRAAQTEALDAAKQIEYTGSRAWALTTLAQETEPHQQLAVISDALEAALDAADARFGGNGYYLWTLIPKLPEHLFDTAQAGVLALRNPEAKAWALAELARRVPEAQRQDLLQQGLAAALQIQESEVAQANALARLAGQLTGDLVNQALDAALALSEANWRPRAVAGLMARLDKQQVTRTLESMLTITDEWWRADGLMQIVEHSSGTTQRRALLTLLSTQHGETKEKIRRWIETVGTPALIQSALDVIPQMEESEHRAWVELVLKTILTFKEREAEIALLPDLPAQAAAYVTEGERLQGAGRTYFAAKAQRIIAQIEDDTLRQQLAERLHIISDPHDRQEASETDLARALAHQYEEDQAYALAAIAQRLPENMLTRALDAGLAMEETLPRHQVLTALADRLDDTLLKKALNGRFDQEDTPALAAALQSLARHADVGTKETALTFALENVLSMSNPWWRIEALRRLIPSLEGELSRRAASELWHTARHVPRRAETVEAIAHAVNGLDGEERVRALSTALEQVWNYPDVPEIASGTQEKAPYDGDMYRWQRIRALGPLLKHLSQEEREVQLTKAVDLVLNLQHLDFLKGALQIIAPYLEGASLARVLEDALNAKTGTARANAILTAISSLPALYIDRAIERAVTADDIGCQASMLIAVAKRTQGEQRVLLLEQAYTAAVAEARPWFRIWRLAELARLGLPAALERGNAEAQALPDEWERTQALAEFMSGLNDPPDVLAAVRRGILAQVQTLRRETRDELFWCMTDARIFRLSVFSSALMTAFAGQITQICRDWYWK